MKGIIFNQLEGMVTETFGLEAWDSLIAGSKLSVPDGVFIGPRNYPDEDLFALVATASAATGKSAEELVRAFGRYLFPKLAALYPVFLKPGMTAKSFLMSVDRVIHVEVRKLHEDAGLPMITYEDKAPDQLVMVYKSPRNLCDLALGLIEGVGAHFKETITIAQPECRKHGAPACRLECTFS
jgi:hypothetical protein